MTLYFRKRTLPALDETDRFQTSFPRHQRLISLSIEVREISLRVDFVKPLLLRIGDTEDLIVESEWHRSLDYILPDQLDVQVTNLFNGSNEYAIFLEAVDC